MFTARTPSGRKNHIGTKVAKLRKDRGWSQRALADQLQLAGLDWDKNAVQRLEAGLRFVTDIEMPFIANVFGISILDLY